PLSANRYAWQFWLQLTALPVGTHSPLYDCGNGLPMQYNARLVTSDKLDLRFYVFDNDLLLGVLRSADYALRLNEWTHVFIGQGAFGEGHPYQPFMSINGVIVAVTDALMITPHFTRDQCILLGDTEKQRFTAARVAEYSYHSPFSAGSSYGPASA